MVGTDEKIELKQMIRFKTGSDEIKGADSFEILRIVSAILKANPEIRVSVEGHTDNRGNAVKKKEDVHRMAEANKAFSHYRW